MLRESLNGLWVMENCDTGQEYSANVPTTMYEVLYENGAIDDPFCGENDVKYTKLSDDAYRFIRKFEIKEEMLKEAFVDVEFMGLDTLAKVYINGKKIATTNNMHRTYRLNIKPHVVLGENELQIDFASPTKFIAKEQAKDPLWGVSSTIPGYEYIRKGHHMFGWDWGPQLPDMGVWRDVNLYAYTQGRLETFYVRQEHKNKRVDLSIDVESHLYAENLTLSIKLQSPNGQIQSLSVDAAQAREIDMVVENPMLWWPNGYGEQNLYTLSIQLLDGDRILDQIDKEIGLRTMTIHREPDTWGETFDYTINGVRIFAMGANYIPEDGLISRPDKERTERLIRDCAKANYNCIRVWGGGIYPSDTFFEMCDRYGLIVWEDFMFACGVYRLTKSFEENIRAEFIDNIKRIRHHACLGLWCGNNEMEEGFVSWGIPEDERLRMDYLLMYEKLIPDVLEEYDPQTFYWPASPSSGGGFVEPNADNKGDVHYWQVFHGNEHYKKFRDHYFRFASEYGMQAFPDMKTIDSYATKEEQNIFSAVMEDHNKCTDPINGNMKIMMNVAGEFMLPNNTEDIVYISQVFQGETIKCAVEHFRRNRGRCMGSTYWQVNDNFPGASWASIDYYGRWKAMHYYARRFYAPLLLSAYEEKDKAYIYLTNDRLESFEGKIEWELRHIDLGILEQGTKEVIVDALKAKQEIELSIAPYLKEYGDERNIYLSFRLRNAEDKVISSDSLLFTCHKFFNFKIPELTFEVEERGDDFIVLVTSNTYAKAVGIVTKTIDCVLEDNYFDLLPGETKEVTIDEVIGKAQTVETIKGDIAIHAVNTLKYS